MSVAPQPPPVTTARHASAIASQLQRVCNSSALATTDRRRPLPDPAPPEIDSKRSRHSFQELPPRWGHRTLETQISAYRNGHITAENVSKIATSLLVNESNLEKSKQLFQQVKTQLQAALLQPNVHHFNTMIAKCAKGGDTDGMSDLLGEMQEQKPPVAPNIFTFNAVMLRFANPPDWDGIEEVLRTMQAAGLQPNSITYGTMMGALATDKNGKGAEELLRKVIARSQGDPTLRPNAVIWASAIAAYANEDDGRNAERLLGVMEAQEPPVRPDVFHYSKVIQAHTANGHWQAAEKMFQRMQKQEPPVFPNYVTIRTMMQAYADAGHWQGAEGLLGQMQRWTQRDPSMQRDKSIWRFAINAYVNGGQVARAPGVLRTMREQDPPVTPNFLHYNPLISAFQERGQTGQAKWLIAQAVESGVFARNAGYNRPADKLDFHLSTIVNAHDLRTVSTLQDEHGKGIPARVAVALLHYHRDLGNVTPKTEFAVGRRGGDRIKNAVLAELRHIGWKYIESPDNPGRLIPR